MTNIPSFSPSYAPYNANPTRSAVERNEQAAEAARNQEQAAEAARNQEQEQEQENENNALANAFNNNQNQEENQDNFNFVHGSYDYDEADAIQAGIRAINEVNRRRSLVLKNADLIVDSLNVVLNSSLKFDMIKESPLLKTLILNESYVTYDKVINNDILESINNINIKLDFLDELKRSNPENYSNTFEILAGENSVNRQNKLKILLPSNGQDNVLIKSFEFSFNELKTLTNISLLYNYSLNIPFKSSFFKKIFLYETNINNEIIGEANLEFGNRIININTNINAIF